MVQLAAVTDSVVEAARKLGAGEVTVSGDAITVAVADPDRDNPELVRAIVEAGGQVRFVTEAIPTLEEVYLKLMGDKQ